jgi:hypothetical protein
MAVPPHAAAHRGEQRLAVVTIDALVVGRRRLDRRSQADHRHLARAMVAKLALVRQAEQQVGSFVGGLARERDAIPRAAQDRRQEIGAPAVMVVGQMAERFAQRQRGRANGLLFHQPEGVDQLDRFAANQRDARDQPRRRRWLDRIGQPNDVDDFGDRVA